VDYLTNSLLAFGSKTEKQFYLKINLSRIERQHTLKRRSKMKQLGILLTILLALNASSALLPPPTCPQISEMSVKILHMLQKTSAFTPTLIRLGKHTALKAA
jgi:hypothetical protein